MGPLNFNLQPRSLDKDPIVLKFYDEHYRTLCEISKRLGNWNWYYWRINGISLQWRHNEHDSVSNHQPHEFLLSRLFGRRAKKTSKLRVTGLCAGNSPETGEVPAQRASNAENVFTWWRNHVVRLNITHWVGNEMTVVLQNTFSNTFFRMKISEFQTECQSRARYGFPFETEIYFLRFVKKKDSKGRVSHFKYNRIAFTEGDVYHRWYSLLMVYCLDTAVIYCYNMYARLGPFIIVYFYIFTVVFYVPSVLWVHKACHAVMSHWIPIEYDRMFNYLFT